MSESMDQPEATKAQQSTQSAADSSATTRVLLQDLSRISAGFADLARDGVALLKAETRLAGSALLLITVLTMMIAFLLAAATLLLVATPVVLLVELGWLGPTLALLAVILLAVLVSMLLFWLITRLVGDLLFQRSRAALRGWPHQGETEKESAQQGPAEQSTPAEQPRPAVQQEAGQQ